MKPLQFAIHCCLSAASLTMLALGVGPRALHAQTFRELVNATSNLPSVDFSKVQFQTQIIRVGDQSSDLGNLLELHSPENQSQLRVVFLGNTLVHRDAEFGYLEAEITRRAARKDIVFRNLGWPGDKVTGSARVEFGPGEEESGSWQRPDRDRAGYGLVKLMRHLAREAPHVVFLAYGSNVAFLGEEGLAEFRIGLAKLLDKLEATGAQVILISPPPRDENFRIAGGMAEQNSWLHKVANHLSDVARQRKLEFVDLFSTWPKDGSFTDNGIHLNAAGYRRLATLVAAQVLPSEKPWHLHLSRDGSVLAAASTRAADVRQTQYGMRWNVTDAILPDSLLKENQRRLVIEGLEPGTYSLDIDGRRVARGTAAEFAQGVVVQRGPDFQRAETLRYSIVKKNRQYFFRYRPQNRAYIQLFRKYERGHHAAELERFSLLVREIEEEIARLRQPPKRIYELVKEHDYPDHEVPGEQFAASVDEELQMLNVPEGFEINLFASDPMIAKPININWDEKGRLWVATSTIYPHLQPGQVPTDRILILEDIDQDGRADKSTVFADDLLVPHSVLPGNGGAYVTQSTDLLFLKDTDGDGKADEKQVLLTGFGNADVHHMIHQLRWGPGGDLYFMQSIYINSAIETPWGVETCNGSCIWRFRPDTMRLEKHAIGLVNPWGHAFDPWGQSFATDGAGGSGLAYIFPGAAFRTNNYAGRQLSSLNPGRPKECGLEFLSGRHLPEEWQNTFLTNDFRANRTTRYRTVEAASGYDSNFLGDMVTSRHRGFRPVDVKMGPDGAIYIVDWQNLIIDHGEVDFHHPLRDKQHGRIWRLTAKDRELVDHPRLADASIAGLLEYLRVPEQWTREQAKRLLRERGVDAVGPVLHSWVSVPGRSEHDLLEALWLFQGLRQANPALLERCLTSHDHRARAAAVRVLSDWSRQLDYAMQLLNRAIDDPHAQVRLEAINALRRVGTRHAASMALRAVEQSTDRFIEFALFRTAHELRDVWLPDFQAGKSMFDGHAQRIAFALSAVGGESSVEPLADLVVKGQLDNGALGDALVVLATFGEGRQREMVLERLPRLSTTSVNNVLRALAQSGGDEAPENSSVVTNLLAVDDALTRRLAMEIAGRWRLSDASVLLRECIKDAQRATDERLAAGQALVNIDAAAASHVLKSIFESAINENVRATALAAWMRSSIAGSMPSAVRFLEASQDNEAVAIVADAVMGRRGAPVEMAEALRTVQLRPVTAQILVDRFRLSGQDVPNLMAAVRRAGQLKPLASLTSSEIGQILLDVRSQGDAARGKAVFERKELQCLACHRVAGRGGRVGPDLSSVGTTERLGDILKSILEPSASIKQGYDTVHVLMEDGRVVSGVLQQETETHIRLRDAQDQEHTIPLSQVDEMQAGRASIMATGLTENLTRHELVDLLRYLSSLGQAGR